MIGDSAGRSAGNPDGRGARRRFTERERSLIDPPKDRLYPVQPPRRSWRLTERGRRLLDEAIVWGSCVLFGAFGGALISAWFLC